MLPLNYGVAENSDASHLTQPAVPRGEGRNLSSSSFLSWMLPWTLCPDPESYTLQKEANRPQKHSRWWILIEWMLFFQNCNILLKIFYLYTVTKFHGFHSTDSGVWWSLLHPPPAHVPHSPCPSLFLLLLFYLNSDLLSVQVMVAVLPFPNKKKLTNSKQKTQHSCSRV